MHAYGLIDEHHARAVEVYTKQCALSVDARDLAVMAATLANGGTNPVSGEVVLDAELVPKVLAVMATAGLYDDSGQWLFHTGLPAKSASVEASWPSRRPLRHRRLLAAPGRGRQQRARAEGDHRHRARPRREPLPGRAALTC